MAGDENSADIELSAGTYVEWVFAINSKYRYGVIDRVYSRRGDHTEYVVQFPSSGAKGLIRKSYELKVTSRAEYKHGIRIAKALEALR